MTPIDFVRQDCKYSAAVLRDIVKKGKIGLGKSKIDRKVKVDRDVRNQLAPYVDSPETLGVDQFNAIVKQNSKKFIWGNIFKGKYSGREHQTAGEYAESAVAYIYNAMNGNMSVNESDDTFQTIFDMLADKNMTPDWIASSYLSVKKLQSEITSPKSYVAAHVNGRDISKISKQALKVAAIFRGKPGIKQVLGDKIDDSALASLYSTGKDTWNKADIVLVNSALNIDVELQDKHFAISDEFNLFLNDLINKDLIIPVSLKKIDPNAKLTDIAFEKRGNIEKIEETQTEIDKIKSVTIILPQTVSPKNKYVGICYLKTNNDLEVDFRQRTDVRESLNIEIKLKTARGGKALSELKRKLNLTSDFYKPYEFNDESAFLDEIKRLTGIQLKPLDSLRLSDPKWFVRPAFKGLIALLSIYQENVQQNTEKVNLVEFFKLLYNCASGANSDSIFYLLTMK